MANTTVMTVRLERALLTELKRAARTEGRSTSGQVVHLLKKELRPVAPPARPYRSVVGSLSNADVAENVEEYRLGPWIDVVLDRRAGRHAKRRRP